jgi:hypothetical protein
MVKDMRKIFVLVIVGIFLFGIASVAQAVCDCTTQESIPFSGENFGPEAFPLDYIITGDGDGHGGGGGGPVPG